MVSYRNLSEFGIKSSKNKLEEYDDAPGLKGFEHLQKRHPCLGGQANARYGRVHLPVSPHCNIGCRFCVRSFLDRSERPGVARGIVAPQNAVTVVDRALKLCPDISVVGVAGPGDSLASPHALEALDLVHKSFPNLLLCMSTNGLNLPENVDNIVNAGVSTITVTVNALDSEILSQLCAHVSYGGVHWFGRDGAQLLIDAQLEGIARIAERGILVKVNTVLVPDINDEHIGEIARRVSVAGARLMNIIPLIPQHQLSGSRAPGCAEIEDARAEVEQYIEVFRHCRHCRADAIGIPGKGADLGTELYAERVANTFSHG